MYKKVREFFDRRDVLEVDTPILSLAASPDPMLDHLQCKTDQRSYYLQSSPEFAMKRLLASGSGSIYQICHCFRAAESGRRHNPEFVMLEWYRVGFQLQHLIDDLVNLLHIWWPQRPVQICDYQQLLTERTGLDYEQTRLDDVRAYLGAGEQVYSQELLQGERDDLYNLVFAAEIEPTLGTECICVLTNYPASQAQLAQLSDDGKHAHRFEVYLDGIELANGYQELLDWHQQAERFMHQNTQRDQLCRPRVNVDERLLAALDHGLPACSGVALGLDRLLMLLAGRDHIDDVIEFAIDRA